MLQMPQEPLWIGTLIPIPAGSLSSQVLIEWLGNSSKALYELSVMTHEAEEGPNLCVSLWWCIFHDGLYIDVTGLNTSL